MSDIYREIEIEVETYSTGFNYYDNLSDAHTASGALSSGPTRNSLTLTVTFQQIVSSTLYEPVNAYSQDWEYNVAKASQTYITDEEVDYTTGQYSEDWDGDSGFNGSNNQIVGEGEMEFSYNENNFSSENYLFGILTDYTKNAMNTSAESPVTISSNPSLIFTHVSNGNFNVTIYNGSLLSGTNWVASNGDNYFTYVLNHGAEGAESYEGFKVKFANSTYSFNNQSGPNCVDKDTDITCLVDGAEKEVKVHNLKPGDMVKTYKDGYRKINRIGYMDSFNQSKSERLGGARFVLLKTDQNGLTEDLYVSARHLILVDSLTEEQEKNEKETFGKIYKVNDKFLVQARHHPDFELIEEPRYHRYYQMTLDNDGDIHKRHGIYTNGYLTESTCQYDYETHLTDLKDVVA